MLTLFSTLALGACSLEDGSRGESVWAGLESCALCVLEARAGARSRPPDGVDMLKCDPVWCEVVCALAIVHAFGVY